MSVCTRYAEHRRDYALLRPPDWKLKLAGSRADDGGGGGGGGGGDGGAFAAPPHEEDHDESRSAHSRESIYLCRVVYNDNVQ